MPLATLSRSGFAMAVRRALAQCHFRCKQMSQSPWLACVGSGPLATVSLLPAVQHEEVVHMADCDVSSGTCSLQVSLSRDSKLPHCNHRSTALGGNFRLTRTCLRQFVCSTISIRSLADKVYAIHFA